MQREYTRIFLLMITFLVTINPACKKKEVKKTEEKIVNVRVQDVEVKPLKPFLETIGNLNPFEEVTISSEVEGILKDVKVDNGSVVSKGMLLSVIDDTDYNLELKRHDVALRQAQATYENTRLEFDRKHSLYKEQLVTQQQFDDVSTRLSLAEADVEKAKVALSLAKQRLIKTKIYSPFSGYVKEKKVSAGDYVKNGSNLFVIIQNNPLKLNFSITEKDIGKLRKGQDVTFKVDAFPGREFKGKVNNIYPSLEEKTRTLQVEALVPNPDNALKPGLFAHVVLYTGSEKNTVLVPIISLIYEGETIKVFVIEDNMAKERFIKVGQKYGEMIEIVEGLKGEEKVVIAGQQNLSEGVKVNVAR